MMTQNFAVIKLEKLDLEEETMKTPTEEKVTSSKKRKKQPRDTLKTSTVEKVGKKRKNKVESESDGKYKTQVICWVI